MRIILATATLLALAAPGAAQARSHTCYLSARTAQAVANRYEHTLQVRGANSDYLIADRARRLGPRTLVVWVYEAGIQFWDDSIVTWHHPVHITVRGGRLHVALEGWRDLHPYSETFAC